MADIPRNYYIVKQGTQAYAIAQKCELDREDISKKRREYLKETFGTSECYAEPDTFLIRAVPKMIPGLKEDKDHKGFFVPDLRKKDGKAIQKLWHSLKLPQYEELKKYVGADVALVKMYMCWPHVIKIDDDFYISNVDTLDDDDL